MGFELNGGDWCLYIYRGDMHEKGLEEVVRNFLGLTESHVMLGCEIHKKSWK